MDFVRQQSPQDENRQLEMLKIEKQAGDEADKELHGDQPVRQEGQFSCYHFYLWASQLKELMQELKFLKRSGKFIILIWTKQFFYDL